MSGRIFLNYRRGDDAGTVGRLFDRLEQTFGAANIFMDVEGHIRAGDDYVDVLREQVAACDVLLAVVGPRWLTIADETGRRRLDNPEDWVRVEIASALQAGAAKRVIPVLVPGAEMPRAEDLPPDLAPLARKQAVRITLERFRSDAQGLVSQVTRVLADLEAARAADTAQRAEAEAVQRQRAADEAARQEVVEARAREQRAAGMSAEDVRKAEELANWDFIKVRSGIDDLRDHLARFEGGITERYARARLAGLIWAGLSAAAPIEQLWAFVDAFPQSEHDAEARSWIADAERRAARERAEAERRAQETEAWAVVAASEDKAAIETFLATWPSGAHAGDAKARLKELRGGRFSRRAVLRGVGYGVGGTLAAAVATHVTLVPGMPVWRLLNDKSVRTFRGESIESFGCVAFATNGRTVIAGSRILQLWEVATGKKLSTYYKPSDSYSRASSVAVAPDGRTAISGYWDGTLKLWAVATGEELRTFTGRSSAVVSVAFARDGSTVLAGSEDGTLKLWEVATGTELRTFIGHTKRVTAVAFAPDGLTVMSSGWDSTLKVWEVDTGRVLNQFTAYGNCVAFAPDGNTAIVGTITLKLWNMGTGTELRTYAGHSRQVICVAFAPNGRTVISGSEDSTCKQWDVDTGKELRTFTGHIDYVRTVAYAPDGRTAISGSSDKTLKLWDLTG